jgi:hypothetical protein
VLLLFPIFRSGNANVSLLRRRNVATFQGEETERKQLAPSCAPRTTLTFAYRVLCRDTTSAIRYLGLYFPDDYYMKLTRHSYLKEYSIFDRLDKLEQFINWCPLCINGQEHRVDSVFQNLGSNYAGIGRKNFTIAEQYRYIMVVGGARGGLSFATIGLIMDRAGGEAATTTTPTHNNKSNSSHRPRPLYLYVSS